VLILASVGSAAALATFVVSAKDKEDKKKEKEVKEEKHSQIKKEEVFGKLTDKSPGSLGQLSSPPKSTVAELEAKREWYQRNYPDGVDLAQFQKLAHIADDTYAALIFSAIDSNHNGRIELEEYLVYATLISHGTPKERLKFLFDIYDINKDGSISFSELVTIVRLQLKSGYIPMKVLEQHAHLWEINRRTPEELAMALLKDADLNHDDRIQFFEFERLIHDIEALRADSLKHVNIADVKKFQGEFKKQK